MEGQKAMEGKGQEVWLWSSKYFESKVLMHLSCISPWPLSYFCHYYSFFVKIVESEALEWLSWLGIQLLILAQAMISGSWD